MNEIIYIPEKQHFRIFRRKLPEFGWFFVTRILYTIDCEGKAWQENLFCAVIGAGTFPAVAIDLCCVFVVYAAKAVFFIFRGLWNITQNAVKVALNSFLGTFLKIAAVLLTLLITYLKWHEITDFIKNLF